jgi:Na+-transporting NADH:ubiquinone oxidoreductase subunit NqrC
MSKLVTQSVDTEKLEKEAFSLLISTYADLSDLKDLPPNIDTLYQTFIDKWLTDMQDFLVTNADSWEFDPDEFKTRNAAEVVQDLGFIVPSHNMIHNTLNRHRISYINKKGDMVNGAVVEVW